MCLSCVLHTQLQGLGRVLGRICPCFGVPFIDSHFLSYGSFCRWPQRPLLMGFQRPEHLFVVVVPNLSSPYHFILVLLWLSPWPVIIVFPNCLQSPVHTANYLWSRPRVFCQLLLDLGLCILVCWLGAGCPGWMALAYERLCKGPIPSPGWLSVKITQWSPVSSSWISIPAT